MDATLVRFVDDVQLYAIRKIAIGPGISSLALSYPQNGFGSYRR